MQLSNIIYYSEVLLKAQHVSSGTSLIIRSSKLFAAVAKAEWENIFPLSLGNGCKYSLELLMMSGVPLETC